MFLLAQECSKSWNLYLVSRNQEKGMLINQNKCAFSLSLKGLVIMDIQNNIYKVLMDLLALCGSILIAFVSAYVKQKFSAAQVDQAKQIAGISVTYAEQVAEQMGFKGPAKYTAALSKVKELAAKVGITMTDAQWQGLIEASLKELTDVWNSAQGSSTVNLSHSDGSTINTIVSGGDIDSSVVKNNGNK